MSRIIRSYEISTDNENIVVTVGENSMSPDDHAELRVQEVSDGRSLACWLDVDEINDLIEVLREARALLSTSESRIT